MPRLPQHHLFELDPKISKRRFEQGQVRACFLPSAIFPPFSSSSLCNLLSFFLPLSVGCPQVPIVLPAGGVEIHHSLTPHRSLPNTSDRHRRALILRYQALSEPLIGTILLLCCSSPPVFYGQQRSKHVFWSRWSYSSLEDRQSIYET